MICFFTLHDRYNISGIFSHFLPKKLQLFYLKSHHLIKVFCICLFFPIFAPMKFLFHISSLLLTLALASACTHHVDISSQAPSPCPDLSNIDTLMWHQPDSALKVMLEFAESGKADSLDEFDGHYCQLLISELLYKNNYAQTNRKDLLKAVDYFDNSDNAFLSARAHYMNGVGCFELDCIEQACGEYL